MTFRNWLRFLRFANALTTVADVTAGWVAARALSAVPTSASLTNLTMGCIACVLIYACGIITNDIGDLTKDTKHHPTRPLPSGQITTKTAWILTLLLILIAASLLSLIGSTILGVAIVIMALIALYNFILLDGSWASGIAMGLCRYGAIALGVVATGTPISDLTRPELLIPLGGYALLILFVTRVSLHEENTGTRQPPVFYRMAIPICYLLPVLQSAQIAAILVGAIWAATFWVRSPGTPAGWVRRVIFTSPVYGGLIACGVGEWVLAAPIAATAVLVHGARVGINQRDS